MTAATTRCGWCGYPIAGEPTKARSSTLFQRDPHPLHEGCADEFDAAENGSKAASDV